MWISFVHWVQRPKVLLMILFGAIPLAIIISLIALFAETHEEAYNQLSDTLTQRVRSEVDHQKSQTLSLALALAQSQSLMDALHHNDRQKALDFLQTVSQSLTQHNPQGGYRFQVATHDLKVFVRDWDPQTYGIPLEKFRKGLVEVRQNLRPLVSIEIGKRLTIKAIVPLIDHGQFLGTLEVIKDFEELIRSFESNGISLMVLMDVKYLTTAEWMKNNPKINGFILGHKAYDTKLFDDLKTINFYLLLHTRLMLSGHYLIASEPMRDLKGERIGFFIAAIDKKRAKEIARGADNLSFYLNITPQDLANIAKLESSHTKEHQTSQEDIQDLLQHYMTAPLEQKITYERQIRQALIPLTKEETINLFLGSSTTTIKEGEIR